MNGFPGLINNRFLLLALTAAAGLVQARLPAAQPFTTLHAFTGGIDGTGPVAGLIVSSKTLYGTTDGLPSGAKFLANSSFSGGASEPAFSLGSEVQGGLYASTNSNRSDFPRASATRLIVESRTSCA